MQYVHVRPSLDERVSGYNNLFVMIPIFITRTYYCIMATMLSSPWVFRIVMTAIFSWSCRFVVVMTIVCTVYVVVCGRQIVCMSRFGCSQEVSSSECAATRPSRQLFPSVRLQVNVYIPVQPGIHTATNRHSLGDMCPSSRGWRGVGQITFAL